MAMFDKHEAGNAKQIKILIPKHSKSWWTVSLVSCKLNAQLYFGQLQVLSVMFQVDTGQLGMLLSAYLLLLFNTFVETDWIYSYGNQMSHLKVSLLQLH